MPVFYWVREKNEATFQLAFSWPQRKYRITKMDISVFLLWFFFITSYISIRILNNNIAHSIDYRQVGKCRLTECGSWFLTATSVKKSNCKLNWSTSSITSTTTTNCKGRTKICCDAKFLISTDHLLKAPHLDLLLLISSNVQRCHDPLLSWVLSLFSFRYPIWYSVNGMTAAVWKYPTRDDLQFLVAYSSIFSVLNDIKTAISQRKWKEAWIKNDSNTDLQRNTNRKPKS